MDLCIQVKLSPRILRKVHSKVLYKRFSSFRGLNKGNKGCNSGVSDLHEYASTLNLPVTDFPLRSDRELIATTLLKQCTQDLYSWQEEIRENKKKDVFILHDGPPYANGDLHLGHALNKVLKDMINRYHLLKGRLVNYTPGWDCHGLPIEHKALATFKDKFSMDPVKVREIAKAFAEEAIERQRLQFKSLAVMGDWENPYLTMSRSYEVDQLHVFEKLVERGLIYRQIKPVYWSSESQTALAEAELEYAEKHKSKDVHVRFPLAEYGKLDSIISKLKSERSVYANWPVWAIIWTTTPWTLIANRAVAVNLSLPYCLIASEIDECLYIVEKDRIESLPEGLSSLQPVIQFTGNDLLDSKYRNLLFRDEPAMPIIGAPYVTDQSGTGLVHNAPGHGMEDYIACQKYGISPYSPVDDSGRYSNEVPSGFEELIGKHVLSDGTAAIIDILASKGLLIRQGKIVHKYPYDWRNKKPVIIRSTAQWFANVDSIKEKASGALDEVKFIPEGSKHRLLAYVISRAEWCISRQRSWGVPIPVLYDSDTHEPLCSSENIKWIIHRIEKEGTDAWFASGSNATGWIAPAYQSDDKHYYKKLETMDVWFDSGTSWMTVLKKFGKERAEQNKPLADVYLEGSDQHRGWFQSSLLTKVASSDEQKPKAPFGTLVTHGFFLDEKGIKMSKSVGNVITPANIIDGHKKIPALGVDGLRLWVAQSDYTKDMVVGNVVLRQTGESLRKFRTTLRYLLGNLGNFQKHNRIPLQELTSLDQYILHQTFKLHESVERDYKGYEFNKVIQAFLRHMNHDLSSFYFDIVKDRLYADSPNTHSRRSVQTVLYEVLKVYIAYLSPILPLLVQETWHHAPLFLTQGHQLPQQADLLSGIDGSWYNPRLENDFYILRKLISAANIAMTEGRRAKSFRSFLECRIEVSCTEGKISTVNMELLNRYKDSLANFCMASQFVINPLGTAGSSLADNSENNFRTEFTLVDDEPLILEVSHSTSDKCPRCWQYTAPDADTLCLRCHEVVQSTS